MGSPWMSRATPFQEPMVAYGGGVMAAIVMGIVCLAALARGWRERSDVVVMLAALVLTTVLATGLYWIFIPRYGISRWWGWRFWPLTALLDLVAGRASRS